MIVSVLIVTVKPQRLFFQKPSLMKKVSWCGWFIFVHEFAEKLLSFKDSMDSEESLKGK